MADTQNPSTNPQQSMAAKSLKHFSCALCHRRKVKCDKKDPCTYCVTHRVPCVPAAPTAPRPRKKRFPEAELLARLRRYEAVLKSYGVDLASINSKDTFEISKPPPLAGNDPAASETDLGFTPPKQEPEEGSSTTWPSPGEEMLRAGWMLKSPSDDEFDDSPILKSYDEMFPNDGSNVLFGLKGTVDLSSLHPTPVDIFRLWQIFIDNVNPLIKLFHVPTMQQHILKSASDLTSVSLATHALLFGIYSAAIYSLQEDDCLAMWGDEKMVLLARYTTGVVYALQSAGFLRSTDLAVFQAYFLYLNASRHNMDPRSLFCLTGILSRMAKRNGYHRNSCPRGVSVFEMEMRRRLWWQVVLLETRTAEMSSTGTAGLDHAWNTKLPLNVNDSDLAPELKVLPLEFSRGTDMLFVLVRCEIAEFLRQVRVANNNDLGLSEFSNPAITTHAKIKAIDDFERHLHEKYFQHCDPEIPTHILAKSHAVYSIGKMKLVAYLSFSPKHDPYSEKENLEKVLNVCLESIEDHNRCRMNKSVQHFKWFLYVSVPFLSYIHLLFHLREMTTGELADRAWDALTARMDVFGRPGNPTRTEGQQFEFSSMQIAFANLMIRAWEAREAALRECNVPIVVPALIYKMREKLAVGAMKSKSPSKSPDPSSSTAEDRMAALHISPSDSGPAAFLPQPQSQLHPPQSTAPAWPDVTPTTTTSAPYPAQPNYFSDLNFMDPSAGGGTGLPPTSLNANTAAATMQFFYPEDDASMWDWDSALSDNPKLGNDVDWGQALSMYR